MGKTVKKRYRVKGWNGNGRLGQRNRKKDDVPGELCSFPSWKLAKMVGTCRLKHEYKSQDEAKHAKIRLEKSYNKKYSVYECPICGKWHLTTHPWEKV